MNPNKKREEVSTRPSYDQVEKARMESRVAAMEKALQCEKVRYKSPRETSKFLNFLENRLTIWDELKDKNFHGKRMHEKTNEIINNLNKT